MLWDDYWFGVNLIRPPKFKNGPLEDGFHGKTLGHGFPGFSPFLGPLVSVLLLLLVGHCIINALTKFVSFHLQAIKL
jgi:hypothetical protein